jgi:hypothetical protein
MLNISIVSHGFRERGESHKQDGETLPAQRNCCDTCQRLAILPWPSGLPRIRTGNGPSLRSAEWLPHLYADAEALRHDTRGIAARKLRSTANTEPFDQLLVTATIGTPKVVKNLAALRYQLEQAAPGMIVFHMSFEVVRQCGDPLGEQRNLDLRRPGVARFLGVVFDQFRLARGRKRHRH